MPLVMKRGEQATYNRRRALQIFRRSAGGDGPVDEARLIKIFARLEQRYKPSYVNLIYRICRAEYSWWPKDVKYRCEGVQERPTLEESKIEAMIRSTKLMIHHPEIRARFFLATVYGLRRVEVARITNQNIDLPGRSVLVSTAKGGVSRHHLIPKCGVKILSCHLPNISVRTMSDDWHTIEQVAGIDHQSGFGWHSIRRSLVTRLAERNVDPLAVKKFMRWRESGMFELYVNFDFRTADREIFKEHPFLKYWEG